MTKLEFVDNVRWFAGAWILVFCVSFGDWISKILPEPNPKVSRIKYFLVLAILAPLCLLSFLGAFITGSQTTNIKRRDFIYKIFEK